MPAMPRTVAVLIFPDFQLLDAAGPIAAFETDVITNLRAATDPATRTEPSAP